MRRLVFSSSLSGPFAMAKRSHKSAARGRPKYQTAWRLVGRFMNHWGELERIINMVIHRCFDMNFTTGSIITSNAQLRDKVAMLRVAIEYFSRGKMSDEWRAEANTVFNKLANFIPDRNVVAHTTFMPADVDGVTFYSVRAKKVFSDDPETWSKADFDEKSDLMTEFSIALMQLGVELFPTAAPVQAQREPNGLLDPRVPLHPPSRRVPEPRSSGDRAPKTRKARQTRGTPRGKASE